MCINRDKDTPLLYAVHNGDMDGCKLLLDNGADCCIRNRADVTTTWEAAYSDHEIVLRYLIVHGNPPLSVPSCGLVYDYIGTCAPCIYDVAHTPLCAAIHRKHFVIAELLLDAGVMMCEEQWCWDSEWTSEINHVLTQQPSLYSRLTEALSKPPSLLHIVRHRLRRYLGQRILTVVPLLEIPNLLKDYLAFRSLEKR